MRVFVEGIGLLGPGLCGWHKSRQVLAGNEAYHHAPTVVAASELLPPAERRRTGIPVKLALAVGREAFMHAGRDTTTTATVFTSSTADGDILHQLCETLASPEREVSPTLFHNSVHNAAAGYWSIATQSRELSTSLCCYDASFAAGLLETVVQVTAERRPVALIAYDQPYPEPLHAARPLSEKFGIALVMAPEASVRALATVDLVFMPCSGSETRVSDHGLEAVRVGNPAARSLPLLVALARDSGENVILPYIAGAHLRMAVAPC